jgi:SAM-dependent methyltransferase
MHMARATAESFGVDADRYDRARPRYPEELIARIVAAAPGTSLLDVGIGTGIEARQLRAAGCRVLGIEPDARMAELARRDGVDVEVSTFEAWDPAGRTFDGVVSATAWHWVDPLAGASKAAQVLAAGGLFAAFWNVGDVPPHVAGAFAAVYERVAPDALAARAYRHGGSMVDGYGAILDRAAEGLQATGAFGPAQRWRLDWERYYTRDEWLDALPTQGGNTRLAPQQLEALLEVTGEAIDALGGGFTMRYGSLALVATRR